MPKKPLTPELIFEIKQQPSFWLLSAERLCAAAEIVLADQAKIEPAYNKAVDAAGREAEAAALTAADGIGHAEIKCEEPNYVPGQLLYAFAIENALKGLIFARHPNYANPSRLSRPLVSHDLVKMAGKADVLLTSQETPVLEALSQIAEWAGRYPLAVTREKYVGKYPLGMQPEALLDWGAQHPTMRAFFARVANELRQALPRTPSRFSTVVALRPGGPNK
jgi:hypothetical protein